MTLPDRSVTLRIFVELLLAPGRTLSLAALGSRYGVRTMIGSRLDQLEQGQFLSIAPGRHHDAPAARTTVRPLRHGGTAALQHQECELIDSRTRRFWFSAAACAVVHRLLPVGKGLRRHRHRAQQQGRRPGADLRLQRSPVRVRPAHLVLARRTRRTRSTPPSSSSRTTSSSPSTAGCSPSSKPIAGSTAIRCTTRTSPRCRSEEQIQREVRQNRDEKLKLIESQLPELGHCTFADYFTAAIGDDALPEVHGELHLEDVEHSRRRAPDVDGLGRSVPPRVHEAGDKPARRAPHAASAATTR